MSSRKLITGGIVAAMALLLAAAPAHAQYAPKAGQGHSRFSFSPVKAKFGGKTASFGRGIKVASGLRVNGITAPPIPVGGPSLARGRLNKSVKFSGVTINGQTDIRKSNFSKSRASFNSFKAPKFMKPVKQPKPRIG